ncbi:hypothetical protein [Helicobacter brantae]|uniref:Motility integral membrane protein n=1 Tax=Helicobacter brantae TaxID=375927 RepID=A0A3D8IZ89_9HELI|nr:hypothetical protein [Helicobacter brantae]RDU70579.1 hypothetical protein CQA58_05250 [Helicobacter brantae]
MRSENFIGLAVVSGFFLGLISGFVAFEKAEYIVIFAIIVMAIFYLIAVGSVSMFNWFIDFDSQEFNKSKLENNLEYYVDQFGKREDELLRVLDYIKKIELNQDVKAK